MPLDDSAPLFAGSVMKKGEFAREFRDVMTEFKLTWNNRCELKLLNLLDNLFPEYTDHRLPLVRTYRAKKMYQKSAIDGYIPPFRNGLFKYDCCWRGCMVYAGKTNELLTKCTNCGSDRFYTCNDCINKNKPQCVHSPLKRNQTVMSNIAH